MRTERYSTAALMELHPELAKVLRAVREKRGFDAEQCRRAKVQLIVDYMGSSKLSAAVLGVSGGIDSSVTAALLASASRAVGSPLLRVVAVSLPAGSVQGASGQERATALGKSVAQFFGIEWYELGLASAIQGVTSVIERRTPFMRSSWSDGQLVPNMRTAVLYYIAALLTDQGAPALVCGTTNRDEGSYLGFFGKAGDGMVDLQVISDLHKSEVRALAELYGIPDEVRAREPSGDVHDGATHREMIGAPYEFIELFGALKSSHSLDVIQTLSAGAREQFEILSSRLEAMHRYNAHKYAGGNPSIHLDIYPRSVPAGWEERPAAGACGEPRRLVGEFALSPQCLSAFSANAPAGKREQLGDLQEEGCIVRGILTEDECELLLSEVQQARRVPVGRNGYVKDFRPGVDAIGSYRATAYSEELADVLWARVRAHINRVRVFDDLSQTDTDGAGVWRAVGVNPAIRFIWYENGGELIPHYDACFDFGDGKRRTLMSLVLYLTSAEGGSGGSTRFIHDTQRNYAWHERNYADWTRPAAEAECLCAVVPQRGNAVLFDHRLLHDAQAWSGSGARVIVRTDIIFERCGPVLAGDDMAESGHKAEGSVESSVQVARGAAADRFFGHLCREGCTAEELSAAGYFDDRSTELDRAQREADSLMLVTPLHRIVARLAQSAPQVGLPTVLVSTGAFCPVHEGHVAMMEAAKSALEASGRGVAGGYLVPDHDHYVGSKCGPHQAAPAEERVAWCREATAHSPWLMVDPWPAFYVDRAVNYSEILVRLELYLAKHIRSMRPLRLTYVCGSDNQAFAAAFRARGEIVVVARPGAPIAVRGSPRTLILDECVSEASSRQRRMELDAASESIQEYFSGRRNTRSRRIFIRDEGNAIIAHWAKKIPLGILECGLRRFSSQVLRTIECALPCGEVTAFSVSAGCLPSTDLPIISIDTQVPGDYVLNVSRCFSVADSVRQPQLVPRPGREDLAQQIQRIPPGRYVLVEDDVFTGKTVEAVLTLLGPERQIAQIVRLANRATGVPIGAGAAGSSKEIIDVGDMKDFLVGSWGGGLVVTVPSGAVVRAPYIAPLVVLSERLSLPSGAERRVSRALWMHNIEFFASLPEPLLVRDCEEHVVQLAASVGRSPEDSLEELCRSFLKLFMRSIAVLSRNIRYQAAPSRGGACAQARGGNEERFSEKTLPGRKT